MKRIADVRDDRPRIPVDSPNLRVVPFGPVKRGLRKCWVFRPGQSHEKEGVIVELSASAELRDEGGYDAAA